MGVQGAAHMPLTPHLSVHAFDPETIQVLTAAFEDAWQSLAKDGIELGPHTDAARDTLAKGIIHAAQLGERDRRSLRDAALAYLAEANVRKAAE
jgi:hypothetical protein